MLIRLLQFLQDVELVWGNAMLYNPSDNVVHKDALFMRNIWHQQALKTLAKEIKFEISTNGTSTPDTRLQVFLAWAQQQFERLFPPPPPPPPSPPPLPPVAPPAKKPKATVVESVVVAAQEAPPANSKTKPATPKVVVKIF